MKSSATVLASMLLATGCSSGGGSSAAPSVPVVVTPAPTPTPTPSPTPSPTPTPTPSPTPTPTPTASGSYMRFADIYIFRLGSGVVLPSACSSLAFPGQPPAVRATTAYGQGLTFRFVITPQVWAISGDGVSQSFDGRTVDLGNMDAEVAYLTTVGSDPVRFSITQPVASGTGLDYARLAAVSVPVLGVARDYHCVVGIPTLTADLATSASGSFRPAAVLGTAHVIEGAGTRAYSLRRSTVSVTADLTARRVALSFRLIATPVTGSGPDLDLGMFAASAPIDPATDNFVAPLTSGNRSVSGTISGRFFGPQALEIGLTFAASVADAPAAPGYSVSGTVFGIR